MQNQNKVNSANFCGLASFSLKKNIEPIQRATVTRESVGHARKGRYIPKGKLVNVYVFMFSLKHKNNGQETRAPSLHAQTTEILMSNINTAQKKTEESKIKTVQNSALSFTDRLTVRPDWFLSLLLDFLLR